MIRKAILEDVEQLTNVHVLSWQSAYRGLIPNEALDNIDYQARNEMWSKTVRESPSETLVAVVDTKVVGFANFGPYRDQSEDLKVGEIRAIYLLQEFWNKGIGTQLLEHTTEALRNEYESIVLWVLDTNQNAIRFYEHHGFVQDGIEKEESVWNAIVHEIRMSKAINSKAV
jgi:GNAT superfamily N-acetyltransferase